ncbi:hypothetical protein TUBRATIS_24990, partial [Tubulinosema ratisbonensis]
QTLASLDHFYYYLEDSKIKNNSLTKSLHEFLKEVRKNKNPIDNQKYYDNIMFYLVKTGNFKLNYENSADELLSCIIKELFDEELNFKNIKVDSFENMSFQVFEKIRLGSEIFRLFGLAQYKENISITLSVFSPGYTKIGESIMKFYQGKDKNFVPDWSETLFLEWPQYIFIAYTSDCLKTHGLKLENEGGVLIEEKKYEFVSASLYLRSNEGISHYMSLNKREKNFYLFNDEKYHKILPNEAIKTNAEITYTVHALVNDIEDLLIK